MNFERLHHQRIAETLQCLDASLLRDHACWFGGGTAIAMRHGEYRESVDMDFMVSELASYRSLRELCRGPEGILALFRAGQQRVRQWREVRADQYGIRTMVSIANQPIKLEIVLEGRIAFDVATRVDEICGVATLTARDMVASKLLANSDRWADDGVFSRDLIDLAMMQPKAALLRQGIQKAEGAYGKAIRQDVLKALERLANRAGWLERCLLTMGMSVPKAVVWQRLRGVRRVFQAEPKAINRA